MKTCNICGVTSEFTRIVYYKNVYYCRKHYLQMYRYGKVFDRTIYDKNDYIIDNAMCKIVLYSRYGNITDYAIIDVKNIDRCKTHKWYMRKEKDGRKCVVTKINGDVLFLHSFILNSNSLIDHKNHNSLDNREENLRECTKQQNAYNMKKDKIIGVVWCKPRNKWVAQIMHNYKSIYLGGYEKFDDAVRARLNAEMKYCGEFAPQKHLMKDYGL